MPVHLVEKLIEEARARGEFDNLPGTGKPIPGLDAAYDELWWVRKWMERENLRPAEELRKVLAEKRGGIAGVAAKAVYERKQR